jgi:hypothetical protein
MHVPTECWALAHDLKLSIYEKVMPQAIQAVGFETFFLKSQTSQIMLDGFHNKVGT